MHCIAHPQSEVVGTCGICGAGLCHGCFASSMYTWDGKPLCPSCNVSLVRNLAAEAFRDMVFGFFRVAFYAGLWAIAIWQYHVNAGDWFVLFFWGGIGAFPTAWRSLRPSLGHAFVNDVELYGNGNAAPWYATFWLRVIGSFILGALVSPVFCAVALFQLVRAVLRLRSFRRDLAIMEDNGWTVRSDLKTDERPSDRSSRKTAARRQEAAYFGPWKRASQAPVVPAPISCAGDSAPAPVPSNRLESVDERLASRMADVDARIAARKAALESSNR